MLSHSALEFDLIASGYDQPRRIGVVVGGSLSKGMVVKLDIGQDIEDLAVGRYVVVRGQKQRYFCMITDVILDNTNPEIQNSPPDIADPFLKEVYIGTMAYGKITIQPMLAIEDEAGVERAKPKPVKTIPGHFVNVYNATVQDVNDVFGEEDDRHFNVGSPLELETTTINLDLSRLVQRSIGVFGKSGTGKSFLTRLILAGVIRSDVASALIFDMHNDYGGKVKNESGHETKGLRDLFGASRVVVGSLDQESSARRGATPDLTVQIGYNQIEPEDLAMLRETMSFTDAMLDAAYMLRKKWGEGWLHKLMDAESEDFDEVEATTNARSGTLAGLQRRVQRFERWAFLVPETADDGVERMMAYLRDGKSIVLEFGRYGNSLDAYILVANYLTRRIHEQYVKAMERALSSSQAEEPRQLLIVIEEAHKFLDPRIAGQTIFGTIAREMRKFNVTLLIVDQRPSAIDEEVMSQIGTRVTALLDNERDIAAVLTGISGAGGLREVLARLDTQQQAIIMGHAVPMPVVIKTRNYDEAFLSLLEEISGSRKPSRLNRERPGGPLR